MRYIESHKFTREREKLSREKWYKIKFPKKCKGYTILQKPFGDTIVTTFAFCSHLDEWDEEEGKRVAYEKMNAKILELAAEIKQTQETITTGAGIEPIIERRK